MSINIMIFVKEWGLKNSNVRVIKNAVDVKTEGRSGHNKQTFF